MSRKIPLIREDDIRAKLSLDTTEGTPSYAATRPMEQSVGGEQLYEMLFYQIPDAAVSVVFRYNRIPTRLSTTNLYPLGGELHASTILKAVYAIVEQRKGERGERWAEFLDAINGSIRLNAASEPITSIDQWPVTDSPAAPGTTFDALERDVGGKLFGKHDQLTYTHPQKQLINNIIQLGYYLFINPPIIPGMSPQAIRWSFLAPRTTLSTVAPFSDETVNISGASATLNDGAIWPTWATDGELVVGTEAFRISERVDDTNATMTKSASATATEQDYTLTRLFYDAPSDFSGAIGGMTFQHEFSGWWNIRVVHDETIRILRQQRNVGTGKPQKAAFVALNTDSHPPEYKIMFWPDCDRSYDIEYQYTRKPPKLESNDSPFGNQTHAMTIRAACLAEAEKHMTGKQGPEWAAFMERLAVSQSLDMRAVSPENFGYNDDSSELSDIDYTIRETHDRALQYHRVGRYH